jgi:photosystem II stability/assembly factor-like uncharacterized protein
VAVLVAVAIIASLLLGAHALRFTIPVLPPPKQAPAAGGVCPSWGYIPGGGNAPASMKMTSETIGWAPGDLRTTDGGRHWHDVSPSALRSGAPYLPGQQTVYPPTYSDFFLDSNHAWLVRSYSSASACVDHLGVFLTSDGGRSWRQSANIAAAVTADIKPALFFLDPQHGWLFVPRQAAGGVIYATQDGGRSWSSISAKTLPCPSFMFVSVSTGWSTCSPGGSGVSGGAALLVTRDGGVTWGSVALPNPPHGCGCSVDLPVFFDAQHGVVQDYGYSGQDVFVTSDGGVSWTALPSVPAQGPGWVSIDFEDARDFWLVGGGGKGGPPLNSLYHSSDGGQSWQLVQKDIPVGFGLGPGGAQVQFLDPMHAFVLQSAQLFITADGGHTWTVIQVQIS